MEPPRVDDVVQQVRFPLGGRVPSACTLALTPHPHWHLNIAAISPLLPSHHPQSHPHCPLTTTAISPPSLASKLSPLPSHHFQSHPHCRSMRWTTPAGGSGKPSSEVVPLCPSLSSPGPIALTPHARLHFAQPPKHSAMPPAWTWPTPRTCNASWYSPPAPAAFPSPHTRPSPHSVGHAAGGERKAPRPAHGLVVHLAIPHRPVRVAGGGGTGERTQGGSGAGLSSLVLSLFPCAQSNRSSARRPPCSYDNYFAEVQEELSAERADHQALHPPCTAFSPSFC
jgi:hypothetical protein